MLLCNIPSACGKRGYGAVPRIQRNFVETRIPFSLGEEFEENKHRLFGEKGFGKIVGNIRAWRFYTEPVNEKGLFYLHKVFSIQPNQNAVTMRVDP